MPCRFSFLAEEPVRIKCASLLSINICIASNNGGTFCASSTKTQIFFLSARIWLMILEGFLSISNRRVGSCKRYVAVSFEPLRHSFTRVVLPTWRGPRIRHEYLFLITPD